MQICEKDDIIISIRMLYQHFSYQTLSNPHWSRNRTVWLIGQKCILIFRCITVIFCNINRICYPIAYSRVKDKGFTWVDVVIFGGGGGGGGGGGLWWVGMMLFVLGWGIGVGDGVLGRGIGAGYWVGVGVGVGVSHEQPGNSSFRIVEPTGLCCHWARIWIAFVQFVIQTR